MPSYTQAPENPEALVGQPYWPIDNSCAICLSDERKDHLLAGHKIGEGKQQEQVTIIYPPFLAQCFKYRSEHEDGKEWCVLVKDARGLLHRVLFFNQALAPK